MDIQVIEEGDPKAEETQALTLKATIDALKVTDQASYDLANAYNAEAVKRQKAFHKWFDPIDESSLRARQAVLAQRKAVDDPLEYVIKTTGKEAAKWWREEEAKAAEEKRKAEEIARKAAEDAQLVTAQTLQDNGMEAAAEAVMEAAPVIPKIEVAMPTKAEGVFYRDNWAAEVVSLADLVKAVAEGKAPMSALKADEVYLNGWARLTKGTESMPGVKVTNTPSQGRR